MAQKLPANQQGDPGVAVTTNTLLIEDKELKGKLACHKRDIAKLMQQGTEVLFKLSHELVLARNTCMEHGSEKTFGKWVEECGMSRSSAYRAIARWEAIAPKILGTSEACPNVGQLPPFEGFLCFAQFDDSAIDELAKPSTPKKALNAAVKIAQSGGGMTRKEAKGLIDKHTKPSPPPDNEPDTEPDEPIDVDSEPAEEDHGKCPACAGDKWDEDDDGVFCSKCHHPHGEPAGDVDEDRLNTQRQKCRKTAEALMRAFDDLQCMKARPEHSETISVCKSLIALAKGWV